MIISKKYLTALMKAGASISNEIGIDIDDDGLHIVTVDPAHVAMLRIDVPPGAYQADEAMRLNVDTGIILDAIKMADNEDNVNINIDEGQIIIKAGRYVRRTPTIEEQSKPRIPNLKSDVSFCVDASLVNDAIKASSNVSDVFRLDYRGGDDAIIYAEQDGGRNSMHVTIPITDSSNASGLGFFPLDYIRTIFSQMKGRVKIAFTSDFPMIVSGSICDSGTIEYLVAPRIESD